RHFLFAVGAPSRPTVDWTNTAAPLSLRRRGAFAPDGRADCDACLFSDNSQRSVSSGAVILSSPGQVVVSPRAPTEYYPRHEPLGKAKRISPVDRRARKRPDGVYKEPA